MAPSNVQVTSDIAGQDSDNPYGDGSGEVTFTVTAEGAIAYKFVNDGVETMSSSGTHTYTFSQLGTNTYTVTAIAVGKVELHQVQR